MLTKLSCHMESVIVAKLTRLFRKLVAISDDSVMAIDIVCSQIVVATCKAYSWQLTHLITKLVTISDDSGVATT